MTTEQIIEELKACIKIIADNPSYMGVYDVTLTSEEMQTIINSLELTK